jgi:UPF0042 nucleotide-binding protein
VIKYLGLLAERDERLGSESCEENNLVLTQLVVVTGLSGSGKTLALRCLEDIGFFAVDNLPVLLIGPFVDLLRRGDERTARGAFVVDVRERNHLEALPAELAAIRAQADVSVTVLFFEAKDETLLRRFSETRRPHPLAQTEGIGVAEAIALERRVLSALKDLSDRVIETDGMTPTALRHSIHETLAGGPTQSTLRVHVTSFGFKHGPPRDADMVLDARFLTNPYFAPGLRHLSGRDQEVVQFLEALPDFKGYLSRVEGLLEFVMPRFVFEGKSYLTIAVGCTGGRHRSVAIAEHLGRFLSQRGYNTAVHHRDLAREPEQTGA